jgi:spore maturation protein CgeB
LATYKDADDCISQINYFLKNEEDREKAAKEATDWTLENLSYKSKMHDIAEILKEQFNRRFQQSKSEL